MYVDIVLLPKHFNISHDLQTKRKNAARAEWEWTNGGLNRILVVTLRYEGICVTHVSILGAHSFATFHGTLNNLSFFLHIYFSIFVKYTYARRIHCTWSSSFFLIFIARRGKLGECYAWRSGGYFEGYPRPSRSTNCKNVSSSRNTKQSTSLYV